MNSQQLSSQQHHQILQLEEEVLANQSISHQLTGAREKILQLEESLRKSQQESDRKSKVIDELRAELLDLKKEEEDWANQNFMTPSDAHDQALTSDITKDISVPSEDCFIGRFKGKKSQKWIVSHSSPSVMLKI